MAIRTVTIHLKSAAPYSSSKPFPEHEQTKARNETNDQHEERMWRHRLHVNSKGVGIIPAACFIRAIRTAAAMFGGKKKGNSTWTANYKSGLMPVDFSPDGGLELTGVTRDNVEKERLFVSSKGDKSGKGGTMVHRNFPIVRNWAGSISLVLIDDQISKDHFEEMTTLALRSVGIGRWRPENGGFNGRAHVVRFEWK